MQLLDRWPLAGAVWLRDRLLEAYAEPGRGYHDLRHLGEVLDRLDELATDDRFDGSAVVLAAWFHDAVYDGRPGAEERSALLAAGTLGEAGLSPDAVGEVVRLVRLTEHHRPDPSDAAGCALVDADLAILAAPPDRYAEYVAGVRREYAAYSDAEFRRGRAAVLADLAARETLFHTSHARRHWEEAARGNLARELAALAG
jgi:predicted metal-dependent HD superfamily phosphohydrolase